VAVRTTKPQSLVFNIYHVLILFHVDDVTIGKEREIHYEIVNLGTSSEAFRLSITDDHSFVTGNSTEQHVVTSGGSANGTFTVKPTSPSVIL
jgi:hypothetical protein